MNAAALLLALLTAAISAACAAADGALLGSHQLAARGAEGGAVAPVLRNPERAHRALLLGRLALDLLAGALVAVGVAAGDLAPLETAALSVLAALALVFFAETGPRAVGEAMRLRLLLPLTPFVRMVQLLMTPVVVFGERLEQALRRIFPPADREGDHETTPEQFRQVVEATAEVSRDQAAILEGVFSLGDTEVQEIMVPRIDIVGIERSTPWSEVVDRVRSAQHSRLPVYDDTIDRIIGILYAKDLLQAVVDDRPPAGGWLALVRPAIFIPEGKPIDVQLREFKQSRAHIAIVVDEYGGTAGLVTIEDILEEIVGEIRDEHDREELPIEAEGDSRFWVAGRVSLDDLSDALGHHFEREDVATVGGLVFTELGRVPRAGEELVLDGFRVVVERVKRRRVERVYFERLEQHAEHGT
ncbi:MAG TPA: hemolysin family protein [Gemmatimonadaceae bacterium]|nr:hemolysin family protein [Gemmatimonadaceae bacterium]